MTMQFDMMRYARHLECSVRFYANDAKVIEYLNGKIVSL